MNPEEKWPQTTVGNLKDIAHFRRQAVTQVDRSTTFGNPFFIGPDGDRLAVIEKHKIWFYKIVNDDLNCRELYLTLMGKKLYCWCDPEPCHAHTIADYLNSLADEHNKTLEGEK